MNRYTLPSSENNKTHKSKKRYDLDRDFIKLYKITDLLVGLDMKEKSFFRMMISPVKRMRMMFIRCGCHALYILYPFRYKK